MPVTVPVEALIVPMPGVDEDHMPPGVALLKNADVPMHTMDGPVIATGAPLTVAVTVAAQ